MSPALITIKNFGGFVAFDYLIPISMIEELLQAVGKTLLEEGEAFRNKHQELVDAYLALIESDG
jgi:hypothetical protein